MQIFFSFRIIFLRYRQLLHFLQSLKALRLHYVSFPFVTKQQSQTSLSFQFGWSTLMFLGSPTLLLYIGIVRGRGTNLIYMPRSCMQANEGRGDRAPESDWPVLQGPIDVVLFEGWMSGSCLLFSVISIGRKGQNDIALYFNLRVGVDVFIFCDMIMLC